MERQKLYLVTLREGSTRANCYVVALDENAAATSAIEGHTKGYQRTHHWFAETIVRLAEGYQYGHPMPLFFAAQP